MKIHDRTPGSRALDRPQALVRDHTPAAGAVAPAQRPRWEYRTCKVDLPPDAGELMQYTQEGWELVAVVGSRADPSQGVCFFKRLC